MFFKYIDAADIRRSLFALRFELKDFEQKLQKLENRLSLYTDTEYRQELIIVEKASALFKQGIPSHLALQMVARELGICLSTVEYVWGLNNQKFKWFKEHAIAYLVQQMHKNGVDERIIRHILEISTHRKFLAYMKKDPETCLHYI